MGYTYTADYADMFKRARDLFRTQASLWRIRQAGIRFSDEYTNEWILRVKQIIAEDTMDSNVSTGRLAAGFGYYDPSFLNDRQGSEQSSPSDAVYERNIHHREYSIFFGTNVPYAMPYLYGFSMDEDRVVYIDGRFVTVHPFVWGGTYAIERAQEQLLADDIQESIFRKHMAPLGFR